MASVEKRVRDGRTTWLARWRDPDGRQRKRSFARKVDADRFLIGIESSKLTGTYLDPVAGRTTLGDWAAGWMAGRVHLKPKTVASYESLLRTRILPRWGDVALARIGRGEIVSWVADMRARGLSASRTRQSFHLLKSMLDDAVSDGRMARNPALGVELPRLPQVERRYLTHDQVSALAEACGPDGLIVLVLAYTGLRWGELVALRVRRVDPLRGRLDISEAVTEIGARLEWGVPKNHAARSVPVPRSLRSALGAACAGKSRDDLVFASPRGTPLRASNFRRRVFDPAAGSVGLDGLTPHELRHTAASLAIAAGASIKAVQAMLGHASATLTLDRYGHLFGDELDAVADRLDAARQQGHVRGTSGAPEHENRPSMMRSVESRLGRSDRPS